MKTVLATINANGGDYELILAIRIPVKILADRDVVRLFQKKEEIPTILADGGISLRQVSANFCCTPVKATFFCRPFVMIQKFCLFDKPVKIFDSLTAPIKQQFI